MVLALGNARRMWQKGLRFSHKAFICTDIQILERISRQGRLSESMCSLAALLRGGLDHCNDPGSDGLGQLRPSGDYDRQVRVIRWRTGSAFSSAPGKRTAVCCRSLAENRPVVV